MPNHRSPHLPIQLDLDQLKLVLQAAVEPTFFDELWQNIADKYSELLASSDEERALRYVAETVTSIIYDEEVSNEPPTQLKKQNAVLVISGLQDSRDPFNPERRKVARFRGETELH